MDHHKPVHRAVGSRVSPIIRIFDLQRTLKGIHTRAERDRIRRKAVERGNSTVGRCWPAWRVADSVSVVVQERTENRNYVWQLQHRFPDYPLVLEVRHCSWIEPRVLDTLAELGVGLCNIDQPLFHRSVRPASRKHHLHLFALVSVG
jgi:hypothetical protein